MKSDIEISREAKVLPITTIADKLEIPLEFLEMYGNDKAKINNALYKTLDNKQEGNLILVTAITPTPLGEGKSTTAIGLVDSLQALGYKTVGALREPSLGPVFGLKGGACGGGYAQVNPMADINLHFTGDLHAITAANNLISACIDNSMYWGNELNIDPNRIVWKRCVDLNDRALRKITVGQSMKKEITRLDSYNISVASEIMAILCLAKDIKDLRNRIDSLVVAYNTSGEKIRVKDLGITGSVLVLLKDAIKPNLVQTLENNPVLIHGGPFANIAHGCNSVIATKLGLKLADYVVTEAGFGADLGCEKFLDIKSRVANLDVSCVVLVATLKALKYHGGIAKENVKEENVSALKKGLCNLSKHIENIRAFNLPFVVALNHFESDTEEEIKAFDEYAKENNIPYAFSDVFLKGSKGGLELAKKVVENAHKTIPSYLYEMNETVYEKIEHIAKIAYGAKSVEYSSAAIEAIESLDKEKAKDFFICMAKTPLSLSDNPTLVGRPTDFTLHVTEVRIAEGAKFIICLTGDVMTMPGLPRVPNAVKIDLDDDGNIQNLS